jgi:anaerobic selenocysteine-containing dehydrogenase
MGLPMRVAGLDLDPASPPGEQELLARFAGRGRVGLDEVRAAPHGLVAPPSAAVVGPAEPGAHQHHRLQLLPDDVAAELAAALAPALAAPTEAEAGEPFPFRLAVRRMREVMNSLGVDVEGLPRTPYNPAHLHPADLVSLGIQDGQLVEVSSAHGALLAVAQADDKVRRGVLSMTHGWGSVTGSPAGPRHGGSNVNVLLSPENRRQAVNQMPLMSAVPVRIAPAPDRRLV